MARWFVDRQAQQGIPSISLRRLLPEARFEGCQDLEVSSCTADSRRIDPGQVFVALRGPRHDGHAFISLAIERGAAGVLVDHPCPEAGRYQVVVPNTRAAYARICQALAGDPSEHLHTLGVAGGVGRTLTALFLRAIFEAAGARYGMIGRLGWSDGVGTHPVGAGLPGAEALALSLAEMVDRGCAGVVIELEPDALEERNFDGLMLDAAVVTGFGTARAVSQAQVRHHRAQVARLFRQVVPGGSTIVNADELDAELLGAANLLARRVSFGIDKPAVITAEIQRLEPYRTRLVLKGFERDANVLLRIAGRPAARHALAAAATAFARGIGLDAVVEGLESVMGVPGRLDMVDEGQPFAVRVDESRTPEELADSLESLRSFTTGRIHCVLGAEGLRDRLERLPLAAAAEALTDCLTFTTDNPRTENPDQILDDLLSGLKHPGRVRVEPNRKLAIEAVLADAEPGDGVLIAGKGRQSFQILADHAVHFDDAETARSWLRSRYFGARKTSA